MVGSLKVPWHRKHIAIIEHSFMSSGRGAASGVCELRASELTERKDEGQQSCLNQKSVGLHMFKGDRVDERFVGNGMR